MKRTTSKRNAVGWVLLAIFVAAMLAQAGCRESIRPIGVRLKKTSQFENEMKRYHEFDPHKAIAVAGDVQGAYAMGYAVGAASQEQAIREAFAECQKRRSERRIAGDCSLYAIDDNVFGRNESEASEAVVPE
jgi:hypothetical protein